MAPIYFYFSYEEMCGPNWPATSIKPWRFSMDDDPYHYYYHSVDKKWVHFSDFKVLQYQKCSTI